VQLRRYLATNGLTDTWKCPDWYPVVQAAKYLGVAPWELMQQSIYWRDKALIAMTAEYQAQEIINNQGK